MERKFMIEKVKDLEVKLSQDQQHVERQNEIIMDRAGQLKEIGWQIGEEPDDEVSIELAEQKKLL